MKAQRVKGNFFLTGDFLRNKTFKTTVQRIVREGHYLGSHSDRHLLYADWSKRDSLLVTRDSFQHDLDRSLLEIKKAGAGKGQWYLPPYEWYNKETVGWCRENGLRVISFTPGTGTNADYTWPQSPNYRSSDSLQQRLWKRERQDGLNGNFILIHLGTDPRRKDKLYEHLNTMINTLKNLGYSIEKLS
ncbi:polysaccharide deacetylase family protein [Niabella hibiscisoli]|uniref:polysaccharide deacetylase family protein n=1 Tax=Niabella hibiscisoli TaxID=1825928 RepID=UPI001F0D87AA|nr:polysaccharide deacetylase family protein [Niabella hibiscisoli]MCH5717770.1 polysaccharide deacetylase family protein [Niabella hibiscisoli]